MGEGNLNKLFFLLIILVFHFCFSETLQPAVYNSAAYGIKGFTTAS